MQPAQHVAPADHLQIVHHGVVAVAIGLLRAAPVRGRMRAGGEDREAVLGGDLGDGLAQMTQFLARGLDVGVRQRHGFDLRLQEFARDLAAGRLLGGLEELLRHRARHRLGGGVDQEIFFLDPDLVIHW